ncbi:formylglycine-generating enzyme family protein [Tenacibaculum soleae]|uniref:hypothetical protein n=1 Tax=Tenacibaculum soleae TaxID=447689 RepID=UPI002301F48E|nr:hypothetical protein [Tenacibaculum soleae]
MNKELNRNIYSKLSNTNREKILRDISVKNSQFTFSHLECFEKNGIKNNTAIFVYDGSEFVFVPGEKNVTLGWDNSNLKMDDRIESDIKEDLDDFGMEEFDLPSYLKESTSPVRKATIPPMLVERTVNEIGWEKKDINELYQFKDEIDKFKKESSHTIIYYKRLKLIKADNQIVAYTYNKIDYVELIRKVESEEGFSLPMEDEWEYLCGGGKTTLFPWGNSFDFEKMNLKHFETQPNEPYTLEQPNHFGIFIAFDPYKYEVVKSPYLLKGGDGGCNICGGLGIIMGYLPVSTHFRGYNGIDDELEYKSDIGGEDTSYRRIFRLNE